MRQGALLAALESLGGSSSEFTIESLKQLHIATWYHPKYRVGSVSWDELLSR